MGVDVFEEQPIPDLRRTGHPHVLKCTCAYYEGSISDDEFRVRADWVAECEELFRPDRVCALFGYGSQPRRTYVALKNLPDLRVLWEGPMLPLWAYPLSCLFSAQGGLVVAQNGVALKIALLILARCAMTEFYCFSAALLPKVLAHVRLRRWRSSIGKVVGTDPGYYCFGLDGGWAEYPAWFSYGPECPPRLKTIMLAKTFEDASRQNGS